MRAGCGGRGRGATGVILQGLFGSWLSEAWDPGRWEETLGFAGARLRENRRACRSSDVAGEDFRLSAGSGGALNGNGISEWAEDRGRG
jgi:hypothetical protein